MTHQINQSSLRVSRSPSKSRSRSSEKFLEGSESDDNRLSAPKFRMTTKSPSPTARRASAIHLSTSTPSRSSSRSRSLRAKRHSAHIPHSLSGTQLSSTPRSSIAHSLSVPDGESGDFHLVRNFSITSKGVINRGDSFRCKSRSTSLCSTPTSSGSADAFPAFSNNDVPGSPSTSSTSQVSVPLEQPPNMPKFTVWLLGTNGVGKTSIKNQFMTSEYICQYDSWQGKRKQFHFVISQCERKQFPGNGITFSLKILPNWYYCLYDIL